MPGGGVALLYASRALDAVREGLANFDQRIGVKIVQSALKVPCKTIADNAGAQFFWPRLGVLFIGKGCLSPHHKMHCVYFGQIAHWSLPCRNCRGHVAVGSV